MRGTSDPTTALAIEDALVPEILPIDPEQGLSALIYSGDGERFVRMFRQAWQMIPEHVRDLLLAHWDAERAVIRRNSPKLPWSVISLRRSHRTFDESQRRRRITFASTSSADLTFYVPTFAIMPDEMFCVVIAHELAHRVMRMENPGEMPPEALTAAYWSLEEEVHARISEWGFDVEAMHQWGDENEPRLHERYWAVKLGLA